MTLRNIRTWLVVYRKYLVGAVIAVVLLIGAWNWLIQPKLLVATPKGNAESLTTELWLEFDSPMARSTLDSLQFSPSVEWTATPIPGPLGIPKGWKITPEQLSPDTVYQVYVERPTKWLGQTIEPLEWRFTTLNTPTLINSFPQPDESVGITAAPLLFFDQVIDPEAVTASLDPMRTLRVEPTINPTVLKVVIESPLNQDATYTLQVSSGTALSPDESFQGEATITFNTNQSLASTGEGGVGQADDQEIAQLQGSEAVTSESAEILEGLQQEVEINQAIQDYIASTPILQLIDQLPYETTDYTIHYHPKTDNFWIYTQRDDPAAVQSALDWMRASGVEMNELSINVVGPN